MLATKRYAGPTVVIGAPGDALEPERIFRLPLPVDWEAESKLEMKVSARVGCTKFKSPLSTAQRGNRQERSSDRCPVFPRGPRCPPTAGYRAAQRAALTRICQVLRSPGELRPPGALNAAARTASAGISKDAP